MNEIDKLKLALERITESAERVVNDPKCAGIKSVMELCGAVMTFGAQHPQRKG